jgi:DNA polymerase V
MLQILKPENRKKIKLPLYVQGVSAGFPSPAEDYIEKSLDLNEYLIKHASATFFVRVKGESMVNAGIEDGDLLIVDRSLDPVHNNIVVAVIESEFLLKRYLRKKDKIILMPENPKFLPIEITNSDEANIWGVVSYVIKKML